MFHNKTNVNAINNWYIFSYSFSLKLDYSIKCYFCSVSKIGVCGLSEGMDIQILYFYRSTILQSMVNPQTDNLCTDN